MLTHTDSRRPDRRGLANMITRKLVAAAMGLAAIGSCGALTACESGSAIRDIDVVYRFDNVRETPTIQEWPAIRAVLARHATTVRSAQTGAFEAAGVTLRSYEAVANVPSVRTLESIQSDLEALGQTSNINQRIRFTLSRLEADYRSNVIAAAVQATVSGIATPRFDVLIYPSSGAQAQRTRAKPDGTWSITLAVVPETRWVYAASIDPAGKLPPTYSRINVSSRAQEAVEPAEWNRLFPAGSTAAPDRLAAAPRQPTPSAASPTTTPTPRSAESKDPGRAAHDRRVAEEQRLFREREIEEQRIRKMRELDERTDEALRRAREAERRRS